MQKSEAKNPLLVKVRARIVIIEYKVLMFGFCKGYPFAGPVDGNDSRDDERAAGTGQGKFYCWRI